MNISRSRKKLNRIPFFQKSSPICLRLALLAMITSLLDQRLYASDQAVSKTAAQQEAFSFVQMCDTQLGMGGYEHDVKTFT